METTLLRKLSAKSILGARPRFAEGDTDGARKFIYRIAGRVTGVQTGQSDFGPWAAFKGSFQAERSDGAIFAGPKAFVPEPVQSMLEDAVQSQLADGLVPSIQFGIDVYAVLDESAATGYTFAVVPILKPADETDSLLAELNKTHALPSPDTVEPAGDPDSEKKVAAKKKVTANK